MGWWNHLKKSTQEEEEKFQDMMEEEKVSWKDKFSMVLAAYITILLPCAAILVVVGLLLVWLIGAL